MAAIENVEETEEMTVKKYNTEFSMAIDHAKVFVNALDQAIQKTNDTEGAAKQLACIGWNDECKQMLLTALDSYDKSVRHQLLPNFPGTKQVEDQERELYIEQLEQENRRLKLSNKSLRTNNQGLLQGINKLSQKLLKYQKKYGKVEQQWSKGRRNIKAYNIVWDTDHEDIILPEEIEIPEGMIDEDEISDYLSDVTGFC